MSGANHDGRYWTPTEVLDWCKARNFDDLIDWTLHELQKFCYSNHIRARWRATLGPGGHYISSDTFEVIPAHHWIGIGFSRQHPGHFTDKVYSAFLPRGVKVEVQFSRDDVRRELRPLAAAVPKPSRLNPYWRDAHQIAFTWLNDSGLPESGDGEQTKLERHIADWLAERGHHPAESTVRVHVRCWIAEFKKR